LKSDFSSLQGDRTTCGSEQTSDFDSVSTTSASYVLNHSDLDSLLNDSSSNVSATLQLGGGLQNMDARAQSDTGSSSARSVSSGARAPSSSKTCSSVGSEETANPDHSQSGGKISKANLLPANNTKNTTSVSDPVVVDGENEKSELGETRRKKSAVSQLIARFENQTGEQTVARISPLPHLRFSRSVTPDRGVNSQTGGTPGLLRHRSVTPDQRPASASAAWSPNESQLKKVVTKSAENLEIEKSVTEVKEEKVEVEENKVDLNDNPVGKESGSVTTPFGGKSESEKVISEKEKHSKDEEFNEDEEGKSESN
jgi:hypothetical protein